MQAAADATPGGMVSVLGLEEARVEELCAAARARGHLEIANLLGPGNVVVSGAKAACDEVERLAGGSP
jgi:[acyl-carrier-protein] S-malonyltransferase